MQRKEPNFAFFYKKVPKNFASSRKSRTFAPHLKLVCAFFGVWCNGNTADSGPAFPGSSPGTPTKNQVAKSLEIST